MWEARDKALPSYECFQQLRQHMLVHAPEERVESEHLLLLYKRNLTEFAVEFCTLAMGSGWNEPLLKAAFHHVLIEEVLTEMACCNEKLTLNSLIDLTIQLDNLL